MKLVSAGFDVSCEQPIASDRLVEPAAFVFGALIAPDDRGPQDLAGVVEQHGAVHLPGKADGGDRVGRDAGSREHRADRPRWQARHQSSGSCSAQAVRGEAKRCVLGGLPTRAGRRLVEDQRARAARADIDAENRNGALVV